MRRTVDQASDPLADALEGPFSDHGPLKFAHESALARGDCGWLGKGRDALGARDALDGRDDLEKGRGARGAHDALDALLARDSHDAREGRGVREAHEAREGRGVRVARAAPVAHEADVDPGGPGLVDVDPEGPDVERARHVVQGLGHEVRAVERCSRLGSSHDCGTQRCAPGTQNAAVASFPCILQSVSPGPHPGPGLPDFHHCWLRP